jgi:hypothetical protein
MRLSISHTKFPLGVFGEGKALGINFVIDETPKGSFLSQSASFEPSSMKTGGADVMTKKSKTKNCKIVYFTYGQTDF